MKLGIDNFDNYKEIFKDKRVGLITNPTGISSEFEYTIDVLNRKTKLVGLFSPEHGVRSNIQAGLKMDTYVDEKTGITVYSLYGNTKKPTAEMMDQLDIMAIDIQDAGSRFYTFIYTMAYAMQACKTYNKEFVVFDRPNPVSGDVVEGTILDTTYSSFIGLYPIRGLNHPVGSVRRNDNRNLARIVGRNILDGRNIHADGVDISAEGIHIVLLLAGGKQTHRKQGKE